MPGWMEELVAIWHSYPADTKDGPKIDVDEYLLNQQLFPN